MRARWWNRMLSLVIAVSFTASTAAPGRFHACPMDEGQPSGMAASMAGMEAHHHAGAPAPTPQRGDCHCVGTSCGAIAPSLPATVIVPVPVPVVMATQGNAAPEARVLPRTWPPFSLPLAQPPPSRA